MLFSKNNSPKDKVLFYRKKWFIAVVLMILLGNIILYNHAYQFTHFAPATAKNTKKPIEQFTWSQKIKTVFVGVKIPKPINTREPLLPYETIYLKGEETLENFVFLMFASYYENYFSFALKGVVNIVGSLALITFQ